METTFDVSMSRSDRMPSFDEAEPLGPGDEAFLRDVAAVLAKHNNLQRFGLCLLHEHFPLAEDEIMLETHDTDARTFSLSATRVSELGEDTKMTSWSLANMQPGFEMGDIYPLTGCKQDKCKGPVALTGCKQDKCKSPVVALTGCKQDKCKAPIVALTGCKQDKCK